MLADPYLQKRHKSDQMVSCPECRLSVTEEEMISIHPRNCPALEFASRRWEYTDLSSTDDEEECNDVKPAPQKVVVGRQDDLSDLSEFDIIYPKTTTKTNTKKEVDSRENDQEVGDEGGKANIQNDDGDGDGDGDDSNDGDHDDCKLDGDSDGDADDDDGNSDGDGDDDDNNDIDDDDDNNDIKAPTTETKYQCSFCTFSTAWPQNRTRHERTCKVRQHQEQEVQTIPDDGKRKINYETEVKSLKRSSVRLKRFVG